MGGGREGRIVDGGEVGSREDLRSGHSAAHKEGSNTVIMISNCYFKIAISKYHQFIFNITFNSPYSHTPVMFLSFFFISPFP